jgi:hypothetical protein
MSATNSESTNRIDYGVRKAMQALTPEVVRMQYTLDNDWSGEPSIFFRVVLSGEVQQGSLYDLSLRVRLAVLDAVPLGELGLHSYFNFRTLSELEEVQDEDW